MQTKPSKIDALVIHGESWRLPDTAPYTLQLYNLLAGAILAAEYKADGHERDAQKLFTSYGEMLCAHTESFDEKTRREIAAGLKAMKESAVKRYEWSTAAFMRGFEKQYLDQLKN